MYDQYVVTLLRIHSSDYLIIAKNPLRLYIYIPYIYIFLLYIGLYIYSLYIYSPTLYIYYMYIYIILYM